MRQVNKSVQKHDSNGNKKYYDVNVKPLASIIESWYPFKHADNRYFVVKRKM